MQTKFSTIDFTERTVDLLDFSAILLVMVSSIGKIKSSMKLYTMKIQTIRMTDVEILDITSRISIQIHIKEFTESNSKNTHKVKNNIKNDSSKNIKVNFK
jgi:hypothetical protein